MRQRIRGVMVAGLCALALFATGCSGDGDAKPEESAESDPKARSESRLQPAIVTIEVTGARQVSWEGSQDIRVARTGVFGGPVNLLSMGFEAPRKTDDAVLRFRWAFDLLNAYADEPGTFKIDSDAEASGDLKSLAFVIVMQVKEVARDKDVVTDWEEVEFLEEYRKLVEGCEVVVGEGELTGSLTCPKLASEEGEEVSLKVSWRSPDA